MSDADLDLDKDYEPKEAEVQEEPEADNAQPSQEAPAPAPAAPDQPQAAPAPAPAPDQAAPAQPATDAAAPMQQPPMSPQALATQKNVHDLQYADDLASGKIQPKTYQQLYNDQSTLGKIGTLFGLMVAGAGSGLTHQPNAVMEMMNKEIERDLEAQKANMANKVNYYNLAQQHERNQALNQLTGAQMTGQNIENISAGQKADMQAMINKKAGVIDNSATNLARNASYIGAQQFLQNQVNALPPGPQKDQQQAMLDNMVKPQIQQKVMAGNQETANREALANAIDNPKAYQQPEVKSADDINKLPVFNQKAFDNGVQLGRMNDIVQGANLVPGAIPKEQVPIINKELGDVAFNRKFLADFYDAWQRVDSLRGAGQVPASNVATKILGLLPGVSGVASQAAATSASELFERERTQETAKIKARLPNAWSEAEKNEFVSGIFGSYVDSPAMRQRSLENGFQHWETLEKSMAPNAQQYHLLTPFPKPIYKPKTLGFTDKKPGDNNQKSLSDEAAKAYEENP